MRTLRRLLALAAALALPSAIGCSSSAAEDDAAYSADEVVTLPHTDAKDQAIGNCWLYATGSWVEALHKSATGETIDLSESYWSYWHWLLQIAWSADESPESPYKDFKEIETGGSFLLASYLLSSFGSMREGDFIPEEATMAKSRRQSEALAAINKSLKEGALKERAARTDLALVRQELDAAWKLTPEVKERLDVAFGRSVDLHPDWSDPAVTKVLTASTFQVTATEPSTREKLSVPLADILPSVVDGVPDGRFAWHEEEYPETPEARRAFLARAQRVLHDGIPPLLSFTVDFAALRGSAFADVPATPGRQGGHMVALSDYEITDVPGFGTLKAGIDETRPEALEAALSPEATIVFLRVKNSWGPTGAGPEFTTSGHYDVYMKYLDGPIKNCLGPDGNTDPNACRDEAPFKYLVLPAGY